METAAGDLQSRQLGAAERLMQLSIDHGLAVTALLAAFARELFELKLRHWSELAAADEREALRLRAEHAGQVAAQLVDCAARLAELGSAVRAGFSRLLTEQLAAGNHGFLDEFQRFFAVLPAPGADLPQMLVLAGERCERALGDVEVVLAQALPARAATKPKRLSALTMPPRPLPPAAAALLAPAAPAA